MEKYTPAQHQSSSSSKRKERKASQSPSPYPNRRRMTIDMTQEPSNDSSMVASPSSKHSPPPSPFLRRPSRQPTPPSPFLRPPPRDPTPPSPFLRPPRPPEAREQNNHRSGRPGARSSGRRLNRTRQRNAGLIADVNQLRLAGPQTSQEGRVVRGNQHRRHGGVRGAPWWENSPRQR